MLGETVEWQGCMAAEYGEMRRAGPCRRLREETKREEEVSVQRLQTTNFILHDHPQKFQPKTIVNYCCDIQVKGTPHGF